MTHWMDDKCFLLFFITALFVNIVWWVVYQQPLALGFIVLLFVILILWFIPTSFYNRKHNKEQRMIKEEKRVERARRKELRRRR